MAHQKYLSQIVDLIYIYMAHTNKIRRFMFGLMFSQQILKKNITGSFKKGVMSPKCLPTY